MEKHLASINIGSMKVMGFPKGISIAQADGADRWGWVLFLFQQGCVAVVSMILPAGRPFFRIRPGAEFDLVP